MTFGQPTTSSPGRRSSVSVRRQIADTLTTEQMHGLVRVAPGPGQMPNEETVRLYAGEQA